MKAALVLSHILAVAVWRTSAADDSCPDGFIEFLEDTSTPVCLLFEMVVKGTWQEQRTICQTLGADLVKLEGELHHRVFEYIQSHDEMEDEAFWIGGSDDGNEGTWLWVDGTAMPMDTPHWYPCDNQPSEGDWENFAAIYPPHFYFTSMSNEAELFAICEV